PPPARRGTIDRGGSEAAGRRRRTNGSSPPPGGTFSVATSGTFSIAIDSRSRRLAVGHYVHGVDGSQSPITDARSGRVPNHLLSVVHVHHGRGHRRGVGGGGVSRVHADRYRKARS